VSARGQVRAALARPVRRARWLYRTATNKRRELPRLIIIGAQKAGTSSLFQYLVANPSIIEPRAKEIHYFDLNYDRGLGWYRAHFPTRAQVRRSAERLGGRAITLEATPYYLFHPLAPHRLRGLLPECRLVVMLRDPVDRAISHYHHSLAKRVEHLPIDQAIDRESERIAGDVERVLTVPLADGLDHPHFSYLTRGCYAEQLEAWFSVFPRDQFLVLDSHEFFADPNVSLRRVCEFAGVAVHSLPSYEPQGVGNYGAVEPAVRERLERFFAPHNERLWELIGERYDWDRRSGPD
jgi:hypothetical protein